VEEPIGNLYDGELEAMLRCRPCPRPSCGCYIGYIHLDHLELGRVYGDGLLERIPIGMPIADDQVSTIGSYSSGASNPASQAATRRHPVTVGGTRSR
jgi:hypothetical protein